MIHYLKTHEDYFKPVVVGVKRFEVRKDDRHFRPDDVLCLESTNPKTGAFCGQHTFVMVEYILRGGKFGISNDYVVMTIKPADIHQNVRRHLDPHDSEYVECT